MKVSKLAMFSFILSIIPIILYIIEPLVSQLINTDSLGFKMTLTLFIFPVLSINSIIFARLSTTYMLKYRLRGQMFAVWAIVFSTITLFIIILRIARLSL